MNGVIRITPTTLSTSPPRAISAILTVVGILPVQDGAALCWLGGTNSSRPAVSASIVSSNMRNQGYRYAYSPKFASSPGTIR